MCNCGKKRGVGDGSRGGGTGVGDAPVSVPTVVVTPQPISRAVDRRQAMGGRSVVPAIRAAPAAPVVRSAPRVVPVVRRAQPVVTVRPTRASAPVVTRHTLTSAPTVSISHRAPVARQAVLRRVPAHRLATVVAAPEERIIDPDIWGPPLWRVLHTLAELRGSDPMWPILLDVMRAGLPCPECRYHYNAWYESHPIGGVDMGEWLLALHNDVNRRNEKAQWTRERVRAAMTEVTVRDLHSLIGLIQGKVSDEVCGLLLRMIGRL